MAFVFMFSGVCKTYFDERLLLEKGQTGVEGLPKWFIKFIGISETLGAIGLIVPTALSKCNCLTPTAAICLGFIMIPAAFIHYKRGEMKNVAINFVILVICGVIAFYRMKN